MLAHSTSTDSSEQSRAGHPQTTVVMTVDAPIDVAFDYIAPINLMHIFRGTPPLISAIVDTSIKAGWNKPGLVRTIQFKDGFSSRETLLTVDAPTSFSYKNDSFTSPVLKRLVQRIEGEWHFSALGSGQTRIAWTYRVIPTNAVARLAIQAVLMRTLHTMLNSALTIAKSDLESGDLSGGRFPVAEGSPRNN